MPGNGYIGPVKFEQFGQNESDWIFDFDF